MLDGSERGACFDALNATVDTVDGHTCTGSGPHSQHDNNCDTPLVSAEHRCRLRYVC
jgi:hypothetical protein